MAHLINAQQVRVTHAARTILDDVSLGLDDGDRIGVVGRNGDGKSTLLRVLSRTQEPESGRVTHTRGIRLGMLAQTDDRSAITVAQAILAERADDHTWAADVLAREVVAGLLGDVNAVAVGGLSAPLSSLSGGQRRRVALAAVLAKPRDVVFLDEPTNHLDIEGVAWLAEHLRTRWPSGRGALVVVTHDRWFLDAVCENTWEVHDGVVDVYDGGYAAYVLARAERSRVAAATEERRQNLLRKELAWLRRGAPARTSKPRFRIDAATALIADEPPPRDPFELARLATARLGKDVIDLEGITYAVPGRSAEPASESASESPSESATGSAAESAAPRVLLDDVTWRLGPGERVGVVGVNGAGKTTLMRLILGELSPSRGRVKRGRTVVPAILSQDVHELDELADLRVAEAVAKISGTVKVGGKEVTAGQLLERWGFAKERLWIPIRDLSGGERRRLQLLRLLLGEPNLLLLDEPTNDLDTDTLAAIEDTLDLWPGTMVVVSHDRYLLERITDRQVALLGDARVRDLPGGVEEYLRLRSDMGAAPAQVVAGTSSAAPLSSLGQPAGSTKPVPDAGVVRQARKDVARIEKQLQRLSERADRLHVEMAEVAASGDHVQLSALDARLRELGVERVALEEEWLSAAELAE